MKHSFVKTYGFLMLMLLGIVSGCVVGALWSGATVFAPLGKLFINMMFCVVVPMVFASIAGAVANMGSRKRAGRIMGVTLATFIVTGVIAAGLMFVLMKLIPPVLSPWTTVPKEELGGYASLSQMLVNFFTAEDFSVLLSRKAMLPLIVFSILFGLAVNFSGGQQSLMGRWLEELSKVMMQFIRLITYYAPIAFFGFFADLVATYGPKITTDYIRGLAVYYPLCFVYMLTAFPLFALFGAGRQGVRQMFRHILRPAMVSLGTCSSVATIPTNMVAAESTGVSKDVSDMVLPLGATMHMDGSCFSCVLKIAFVCGVLGQELSWGMLIPVVGLAALSSVGMSGVPGGGYIGEYIICSVFFPNQMELAFPILVTIGNLVDPPATMINASGDYVVSFIVSRFVDGKDWLKQALRKKEA